MESVIFKKSYVRDTTLFMQGLWARGLTEEITDKFGWVNPHLPFVAHFVNNGVVEIWEHKAAIDWLLDKLLGENEKGAVFLSNLFADYQHLLRELGEIHAQKYISTPEDIEKYIALVYKAALYMTMFFYVGADERSPKEAQAIAVQARRGGDFFADNDVFVKKSIARIGNISEELAGVVLPEEMLTIPAESVLEQRMKSYLLIDGKGDFVGSLDDFSKENPQYVFPHEEITDDIHTIVGKTAYKGFLRGYARIVRKQSDMPKVLRGDILVAPMTTPDFLPAMDRAAAFVTDEGGITCHAAIVARELKKPCVIGTRIATQVLHDGDLVEVDADNGVVRILK
jgi:phosphohistidine swiveling domain-containing protein